MRRTPWGLIGLLVAAGIVAAFHVGKVPPALPSIRAELGATLRQAGWLLSTVNLISAVGGMAIALTADRVGHLRLVILGTTLSLVASLCGAICTGVDGLLVTRVVEGLGFTCLSLFAVQDLVALGRLVRVQTTLPRLVRRFYLVHHRRKQFSPSLARFMAFCQEAAAAA